MVWDGKWAVVVVVVSGWLLVGGSGSPDKRSSLGFVLAPIWVLGPARVYL